MAHTNFKLHTHHGLKIGWSSTKLLWPTILGLLSVTLAIAPNTFIGPLVASLLHISLWSIQAHNSLDKNRLVLPLVSLGL